MALGFGMLSGIGLTGLPTGGLTADAGLELLLGLGTASIVAVGWKSSSPGGSHQGRDLW